HATRRYPYSFPTRRSSDLIVVLTIVYMQRLATERDIAERERLTATRVSQFMTEVFRVANPSESRGNSVPVREVLDAAVARIDSEDRKSTRLNSSHVKISYA